MARKKETQSDGPKKQFPRECPGMNTKQMCEDLREWGEEWQTWGTKARDELKFLRQAICNLERRVYYGININQGMICNAVGPIGGGPPADPTGDPPKPPFKP